MIVTLLTAARLCGALVTLHGAEVDPQRLCRRMLAAVNLPASPLATLPSEARYLDCPACGERRRHDIVRIDGAVRWWSCSCGNERALDSVATVTGGAS